MAIAFRAMTTDVGSGSLRDTVTLTKPTGTAEGDALLAVLSTQAWAGTSLAVTPPAGWTSLRTSDPGDANRPGLFTFYKVAGASEAASYAFTLNSSSFQFIGAMLAYEGAGTSPIDVSAIGDSGTTPTAGAVTTTVANAHVIAIIASKSSTASAPMYTPPSGMTERVDAGSTVAQTITVADVVQASAGSTGTKSFTPSAAITGGTYVTVALSPLVSPTGTGALSVPAAQLAASGKQVASGTGALSLVIPVVDGDGAHTDVQGTGALGLWVPAFEGSSLFQGAGAFSVAFPTLAATGWLIPAGDGALTLWLPSLTGEYVEPYRPYVMMRGAVVFTRGTRMAGPIVL
jgi:hypothetical protein